MKHLLNDLTEKEKNSIREQHTGGMNVVTENFSKLINAKSGDVKPLVNEQPGSNMANAIGSLVKSTQNVYKKYPQYHDKDGMIGELGKMYNYVMDVWIKEDGGSSFGLEPDSTEDTHSITNGGRKVVWDFKQNKIFFEKDLKFDPTSLTLNSTNFNAFKSWFDKNNQQSDVSDLGWMAKSVVKQGLGLKESDLVRLVKRIINEREGEDYSDLEKEFDDDESPIDCEHLFKSMDFIYDDYMSQISLSPDEIDEADAEDIYDEFETELGGILDLANQTECDDKTIQDLEIVYNEYLSEMADKLGLR